MRNIVDQASEMASDLGSKASDVASSVKSHASDAAHYMGESPIASTTGRIPTDAFLIAAAGSIVASLTLKLMGRSKDADFVGHWAPTLISLGLLSKLVEHDRHLRERGGESTPARAGGRRQS